MTAAVTETPALPTETTAPRLNRTDWLLLLAFCLLLFGYQMFSGRPLSLHEARLPELSREMLHTHQFLFPQSGGRPWLERPPIPHWILVGTSALLGQQCDSHWVVRLPSVVMGTAVVLLTAWMAALWFGRTVGLLSGYVLATLYEFYAYCILAEDDIFLAAAVALAIALFVKMEFTPRAADRRVAFFGNRPWELWLFFIVLGAMNMIKSPLIGPIVVVPPIALFLLLSCDSLRIRRYLWLWGGLAALVLFRAWTQAAAHRYPDVLENWKFDYKDTTEYDEPWWYYAVTVLPGLCMPWIWASVFGFLQTLRSALADRLSPARFLWCWAIVPVIVLSIPHRKHHHYLVPSLAPWAILSAVGLFHVGRALLNPKNRPANPWVATAVAAAAAGAALAAFHRKIPIPFVPVLAIAVVIVTAVGVFFFAMSRRRGALAMAACFVGVAACYCWGQSFSPDKVAADTAFLRRAEAETPPGAAFFINGDLGGELDFFRNQFYVRPSAGLLHNLTYLRDQAIRAPDAWVITPLHDLPKLQTLGEVTRVDQSAYSRREKSPQDRFALFHIRFRPDLVRYPRPPYIDTLQAMGRRKGPYCGPPFP